MADEIGILIQDVGKVKVVTFTGEINTNTAPVVTEKLEPLVKINEPLLLLDMTEVPYMSSAGLRTLLYLARQTVAKKGRLVLVGLSEDLKDTMSVTGFLDLLNTQENLNDGLKELEEA